MRIGRPWLLTRRGKLLPLSKKVGNAGEAVDMVVRRRKVPT